MTDAIIIGGGVVGASVAYRLVQAGVSVTVLEIGRVGGGASGASFGWINAHKTPRSYHDFNVAGMRAHRALEEEFGSIPWWHGGGTLEWYAGEADRANQHEKVGRLRSWGYAVNWITSEQLKEMEPDVDLAGLGENPIAHYPDEAWIDPVLYAHAMIRAAMRSGATIYRGIGASTLQVKGGQVRGVRTTDGGLISANIIINCTGCGVNDVVPPGFLKIPLAPTVGLLVVTQPVATLLGHIVFSPLCYMRPDGAGRLMIGMTDTDQAVGANTEPSPNLPPVQQLINRAADVLPSISGVKAEAVRIGVRPIALDGYPVVGQIPDIQGYYVVVTHSGVTLAPLLGRAVADELAHGRIDPQLEQFRPNRFALPSHAS